MDGQPEMVECKWAGCTNRFTSELDMGLHVLTNHVKVLDYGHFVLDRRAQNKETDKQGPVANKTGTPVASTPAPPETSDADKTSKSLRAKWTLTPAPEGNPDVSNDDIRRVTRQTINSSPSTPASQPIAMSSAARDLLNRLRRPPVEHHRLFQTEHFCLICQYNHTSPCKKDHKKEDLQVVADWKRIYGHLKPAKKLVLKQIKQIADAYAEEEIAVRLDFLQQQEAQHAAPTIKTEQQEVETGPRQDQKMETSSPLMPRLERQEPHVNLQPELHDEAMEVTEEREEGAGDETTNDQQQASDRAARSARNTHTTMSRLCTMLIYRINTRRISFRAQDRDEFCINCLSYQKCDKQHGSSERRLARKWKRRFGGVEQRLTGPLLVEQLEQLKAEALEAETEQTLNS